MFGYVKPRTASLRVGENEYYKALYCGLCRTIKKNASRASSFALNYDFVFLALWRMLLSGERPALKKRRCPVHPLKKRPMLEESPALDYCGDATLILSFYKLSDDICDPDKSFFKKLLYRLYLPVLKRNIKKRIRVVPALSGLCDSVKSILDGLSQIEKRESSSIDEAAAASGQLLAQIASFGLEGTHESVTCALATALGKYIYLIDACDDLESDEKTGSYNPLLIRYGCAAEVKKYFSEIDFAISDYIKEMSLAAALPERRAPFSGIIDNIIEEGLSDVAFSVLHKGGTKGKNEKSL